MFDTSTDQYKSAPNIYVNPTSTDAAVSDNLKFCAQINGRVVWQYAENKSQIHSLYTLAKSKNWNADCDVPWQEFNRESSFPCVRISEPLLGFPEFDALPEEQQRQISWWRHGLEISEILHGEQGALLVASQLVNCMPTVDAKLFASSQVFDEARHVEFFSRYLLEVVGEIQPPSAELHRLISTMLTDPRWDMKFLTCQILIESLAMARFQEIRQTTQVPVLAFAIDYIARDEARHVKFGTEILRESLADMNDEDRESRSAFVLDSVMSLANSLNIYTRIAARLQWDAASLRRHLRQYRIRHPELNNQRFRQLILNLKSIGLLTESTRERLLAMHLV